jgi:hypothetical protein
MITWDSVTTAWRILRFHMQGMSPVTEDSCKYIEKAVKDNRKGVVLQPRILAES